jgi:hypothetical protein
LASKASERRRSFSGFKKVKKKKKEKRKKKKEKRKKKKEKKRKDPSVAKDGGVKCIIMLQGHLFLQRLLFRTETERSTRKMTVSIFLNCLWFLYVITTLDSNL